MKRFFFTAIAIAVVAVGCTKSGLLETPQNYEAPISFEPYTGKAPITRATVEGETSLKAGGFHVTGFIEGDNNTITNDKSYYLDKDVKWGKPTGTGDDVWYYDDAMYWPEGETLSFVAYGLNVNNNGDDDDDDDIFTKNNGSYTSFTYTVPNDVADQKDLVISPKLTNKSSTTTAITVTLYHVLSKVGFQLRTSGASGIDITINSIRLEGTNFKNSRTFNLENEVTLSGSTAVYAEVADAEKTASNNFAGSYSLFGTGQSFVYTTESAAQTDTPIYGNTAATNATAQANTDRWMMILPQTLKDAKIVVDYELEDSEPMEGEVNLGDFEFKAGKAYEFIFTVSTVEVGFSVEVNGWGPGFTDDNDASTETEAEGYFPLN